MVSDDETKRLQDRAEECLALAEVVGDEQAREGYLKTAEILAVSADLKRSPNVTPNSTRPKTR